MRSIGGSGLELGVELRGVSSRAQQRLNVAHMRGECSDLGGGRNRGQ